MDDTMVLHTTATEHFQKLSRLYQRLEKHEVHVDMLDDFFQTASRLPEIVAKDPLVRQPRKKRIAMVLGDPDMRLCQEIALRQRHYTLHLRAGRVPQIVGQAEVKSGWGMGRVNRGSWGVGEQTVVIRLSDGTERNALHLVRAIFSKLAPVFDGEPSADNAKCPSSVDEQQLD